MIYRSQWCKIKGITNDEINQHPHRADLLLLLTFREALWNQLDLSQQATWGAYWGKVYYHNYKLHKQALTKLEMITIDITARLTQGSPTIPTAT
jgi:hypothetical protein